MLWVLTLAVAVAAAVEGHGDALPRSWQDTKPDLNTRAAGERAEDGGKANDNNLKIIDIRMPGARPDKEDEYMCTSYRLRDTVEQYITSFEAQAIASVAHHMILFGCEEPAYDDVDKWTCGATCGGNTASKIMYAWARNAPPTRLPKDVGFRVGGKSKIRWLVLQIHYLHSFASNDEPDTSGVRLTIDPKRQNFIGGIYLLYTNMFSIPADKAKVSIDVSCEYDGKTTLHPFAFRVHTHNLGRVVSGYVKNNTWNLLGKGNPQWPQAFYPMNGEFVVKPGDTLAAMCTYDSTGRYRSTQIGSTHHDEMCNFYMMYYTDESEGDTYYGCGEQVVPLKDFPASAAVLLPPNPKLEAVGNGDIHKGVTAVKGWPQLPPDVVLGQVAGVAVDSDGNTHIFHRGPTVWNGLSFDVRNKYNGIVDGPIKVPTLLVFDHTGKLVKQWGANRFYMPHGLHIDSAGHIWVTDVALHQVMRFPSADSEPDLVLGTKFEPGSDNTHFCKPSDVTVLESGEFYITDGYCNARVMKYSKDGTVLKTWGNHSKIVEDSGTPAPGTFNLPHSITYLKDKNTVCVADRENGRIQCFDLDGNFVNQINPPEFQGSLYAVTYSQARGQLFAVNGHDAYDSTRALQGFTINPDSGKIEDTWSPKTGFHRPHDIAVSADGEELYVAEIGPNKIWKFSYPKDNDDMEHKSVKKGGVVKTQNLRPEGSIDSRDDYEEDVLQEDVSDFGASLIIGSLLIIPVVIIVSVTVFLRLKRNGKLKFLSGEFSQKRNRRFNLGSIFSQHKGFDRVRNEDSDELDPLNSDSEVEEYSATTNLKA